jgi:DNA-binding NtrC family response regulator
MSRILVIEDDESFRRMLSRTLQRAGHQVVEAANGRQGVNLLSVETVDLVLTDIIMPDMEGLETIRLLRKSYPDLKVIAMSGGGRLGPEGYLKVAHRFGAMATLSKPFDNNQLFAAVDKALGLKDPIASETSPW